VGKFYVQSASTPIKAYLGSPETVLLIEESAIGKGKVVGWVVW